MKLVFKNYYAEATGEHSLRYFPDSILLTREQFNELRAKIAGDAFDAGFNRSMEGGIQGEFPDLPKNIFPNKQQYLSSLNSKENE